MEPFFYDIYIFSFKQYASKGWYDPSFLIELIYINLSRTIITFKVFSLRMSWILFWQHFSIMVLSSSLYLENIIQIYFCHGSLVMSNKKEIYIKMCSVYTIVNFYWLFVMIKYGKSSDEILYESVVVYMWWWNPLSFVPSII